MQPRWCLGVKVARSDALPQVHWQPPEKRGDIFGFPLAYYNPCHEEQLPKIDLQSKVGFYGVCSPFPAEPVCAIARDLILTLILVPLTPAQAQRHGWDYCERIALQRHDLTTAQAAAA